MIKFADEMTEKELELTVCQVLGVNSVEVYVGGDLMDLFYGNQRTIYVGMVDHHFGAYLCGIYDDRNLLYKPKTTDRTSREAGMRAEIGYCCPEGIDLPG